MNLTTNYLQDMKELFLQRNYKPATINSYIAALKKLFEYYNNLQPKKISFDQIAEYTHYLIKRKKLAKSTVRISLYAFDHFYNSLHHKKYNIQSLKPPPSARKISEFLSPAEVSSILNSIQSNRKHYIIISLIYSTGLGLSQIQNLKLEDIDCDKKRIKVRDSNKKIIRKAIIADHLINELKSNKLMHKNSTWLFERIDRGKPFSTSSIQKAFKKALIATKIKKKVTIQSLKYTYIKHMELYGVPLPIVLKEMGIFGIESYYKYCQIGLTDESISFSPLDRILHDKNQACFDTVSLEKSFTLLQDKDEKSYLLESLKCFKARAPRAAVILAWNAAIRNIQNNCLRHNKKELNKAIKKYNPKAPRIGSIEDFEKIKERHILETSHSLKIYSKHEKDILINCLGLRNKCGHPSKYIPKEHRVASFLEDLHTLVFSKQPNHMYANQEFTSSQIHAQEDGLPF